MVIAAGANSNTFGIKGVGENALFLKDVSDARRIRQRVIECFEHAGQPNITEQEAFGLLHFAVVGGGPTVSIITDAFLLGKYSINILKIFSI